MKGQLIHEINRTSCVSTAIKRGDERGSKFYTDNGQETPMGRYAFWDDSKEEAEILECSNNLAELKARHGEHPILTRADVKGLINKIELD